MLTFHMWNNVCLLLFKIFVIGASTNETFSFFSGQVDELSPRSFLIDPSTHWPDGVVPYETDPKFTPKQVKMILDQIHILEKASCVRWRRRKNEKDYVAITRTDNAETCSSKVGRVGGRQKLHLGDLCFDEDQGYRGAVLHEMMHALGFIHEQQRLDRDCFVWVYYKAILQQPYDYAVTLESSTKFPYDFKSIMHYKKSKNMFRRKGGKDLGNEDGLLTKLDVMKLNYLYCGGKAYCELDAVDCWKRTLAEKACRNKPDIWQNYVKHKYNGSPT